MVSAVTFAESVVNGLHFEFLNSPRYESERRRLQGELSDPVTSRNRKENLGKLFGVNLTDPSQRLAYIPTEWKLKHLPRFLSGVDGNVPDLSKPPFNMFVAVSALWRNTFIHPSYEPEPLPRLPERIREWLKLELGGVPSKMWLLLDAAVDVEDKVAFATATVDCTLDVVEKLYELSFGSNHGLLWWLGRRGSNGRFPDPDDWDWLRDQFAPGSGGVGSGR